MASDEPEPPNGPYVHIVSRDDAEGELARLYKECENEDGTVDCVLAIHSQRPGLRKLLPEGRQFIVESILNGTDEGLTQREAAMTQFARMLTLRPGEATREHVNGLKAVGLTEPEVIDVVQFARMLTLRSGYATREHVNRLKAVGLTEPEIIDVVQVIGYFAYVRRVVAGLGVTLAADGMRLTKDGSRFEDRIKSKV